MEKINQIKMKENRGLLTLLGVLILLIGCGGKNGNDLLLNTPPTASAVAIKMGKIAAEGDYIFSDKENDTEGNSLFQWYRAGDENGANVVKITNATQKIYTYTTEDKDKYLSFEVIPVQKDGKKGTAVKSQFIGKVTLADKEKASNIKLKFLDEYVYPANQIFRGTKIGGLSGIDYKDGTYYIVTDDFKKPRYYKAKINIENQKIRNVSFIEVVVFDKEQEYYAVNFLDLESIVFQNGNLIIASEGSIYGDKKPNIFIATTQGDFVSEYTIPNYFVKQARHNGIFESLTKSVTNQGVWCANELPLKSDGIEPEYPTTHSPLRFTYYDTNTKQATKEFVYELSPLPLPKKTGNDMNGVSDILEYQEDEFLVIERAFQGKNIVKIFKATIKENTTNLLGVNDLKTIDYVPMQKELVFDSETIEKELKNNKIDNIEGITFGENLPNGNKTIILISDDNFQKFGLQSNQFLLFELIES